MRGQARFVLSLVMDGISEQWPAPRTTAACAPPRSPIDDTGLLAKLLPAWAKEEGVKPEELVQTALMGARRLRRASRARDTLKALDAVASFIADWKAPKGPLVLGLKPAKTAGLVRPRQDRDAQRAHDRIRLHRHLSRHQGGGGQGRPEVRRRQQGRNDEAANALLPPAWRCRHGGRPGAGRLSVQAHPDDRALSAGRRGRHHRAGRSPM